MAYEVHGLPTPLPLKAHSIQSMALQLYCQGLPSKTFVMLRDGPAHTPSSGSIAWTCWPQPGSQVLMY